MCNLPSMPCFAWQCPPPPRCWRVSPPSLHPGTGECHPHPGAGECHPPPRCWRVSAPTLGLERGCKLSIRIYIHTSLILHQHMVSWAYQKINYPFTACTETDLKGHALLILLVLPGFCKPECPETGMVYAIYNHKAS